MTALNLSLVIEALPQAVRKLDPRRMATNPVMLVVEVGAAFVSVIWLLQALGTRPAGDPGWYTLTVGVWLWLTVLFGNLAEAIAEGRGRAQAASLRAMRSETVAQLRDGTGAE